MDTLEPYEIAKINKDKITKKLIDIFNGEYLKLVLKD